MNNIIYDFGYMNAEASFSTEITYSELLLTRFGRCHASEGALKLLVPGLNGREDLIVLISPRKKALLLLLPLSPKPTV